MIAQRDIHAQGFNHFHSARRLLEIYKTAEVRGDAFVRFGVEDFRKYKMILLVKQIRIGRFDDLLIPEWIIYDAKTENVRTRYRYAL